MADIRPFCALRPKKGMEAKIAALPYDVYTRAEAKEAVQGHPDSFLNIDRAETGLDDSVDTYADEVYARAKTLLWDMVKEGKFIREDRPCYYIYQLEMNGRKQTGIAAASSVDDYLNNVIKKHENTRADKEVDRIRHVDTTNAQTGPIFLAFRRHEKLSAIVNDRLKETPVYDFCADDGIYHRMWVVSDADTVDAIRSCFSEMDRIYIADGHHRCASAAKVAVKRREEFPGDDKNEEYNFFLSVLFPEDELKIMDYNRVLLDAGGKSEKELLEFVSGLFSVEKLSGKVSEGCAEEMFRPAKKGEMSMYLAGTWYRLNAHPEICSDDAVDGLDVSVLQNAVLEPFFGITDPKTDQRIKFVGGIRGLKELEKEVDRGGVCAFAMYPTSITELFDVADAGRLMPPKSTWFEPKLRSGLLLHDITRKASN
ncbi:MAG: DUF1015 family protein [Lachnospiraceae bacterium]|nr:DUF1015 family protein [Lachnospiraceae bacterium]